jgi:thiol-disulfide isomerase/thioredoxin
MRGALLLLAVAAAVCGTVRAQYTVLSSLPRPLTSSPDARPPPQPPLVAPVILDYYWTPSCLYCRRMFAVLRDLLQEFPGQNLQLNLVNMDIELGKAQTLRIYSPSTLVASTYGQVVDRTSSHELDFAKDTFREFIKGAIDMRRFLWAHAPANNPYYPKANLLRKTAQEQLARQQQA